MESKRYVAFEMASNKIRMLIGYMLNGKVYVLHALESKALSSENGILKDVNECANALKSLKEEAQKALNIQIMGANVVIPPFELESIQNKGSTRTHLGEIIDAMDVRNAIDYAKNMDVSLNSTIIDSVPYLYILDNGERYTIPPIGKKAKAIETHVRHYAIYKAMKDFYDAIFNSAGIKVTNYMVSPFSAGRYLATSENLPTTYFMIDMGENVTTFSLVHGGYEVLVSKIVRFSGSLLTKEIASNCNMDFLEAEASKCLYGIDEDPKFDYEIKKGITLSKHAKVIKDYLDTLIEKFKSFVKLNMKNEERKIPLILIGGGFNLKGVQEYFSKALELDVYRPIPYSFGARSANYISLLGAITYATQKDEILKKLRQEVEEKKEVNEFDLVREAKNGSS